MKANINHISYYIPVKEVSNNDISKSFPEWDSDRILSKIGISSRNIAAEDEFVSDMAIKVINQFFKETNFEKEKIDFLLLCTQSPDYFLPTTACIVQHKVGLRTDCGAIDVNQGCSGYIYGLSIAKGLVVSGVAKNVLLVTAETYSKHIHKNDKGNISLFGDAATATLISQEVGFEICEFNLGTDGAGAENLIIKNGAVKNKCDFNEDNTDNYLFMNGSSIFDFTSKAIPPLVEANIIKNNLSLEDIDTFIFHQANTFMLNFLRKKIGIPEGKFVIDMINYGNTVSSTIPIAFKNRMERKEKMKNVMLVGFGVGYSWGAVCLKNN